ncbi:MULTISPECIES: outer membrane protein [Serratia]|uniref:outer membrane protein n=1 Tax=Serratia TaxID=613 RepID=UPI002882C604|nr:outer membrane beta-barrel protein [Serratia marcescens]MDT0204621.1 outer membrane beta-barrel protein [Serratia marcescens]
MKIRVLTGVLLAGISAGAMAETTPSGFYLSAKAGVSQFRSSENVLNSSGTTVSQLAYDVDASHLGNASKTVFTPGIALGYRFANELEQPVRVELAFQHFGKSDKDFSASSQATGYWGGQTSGAVTLPTANDVRQSTRVSTLMVNTYYDYTLGGAVTPYLMAGIGAAFVRNTVSSNSNVAGIALNSGDFSNRKTNLAWALGAGVSWAASDNVALEMGYTFTNAGDIKTAYTAQNGINEGRGDMHTKVQLHTLHAGVRYHF